MILSVTGFLLGNLAILQLPLAAGQLGLLGSLLGCSLILAPVAGYCCRLPALRPVAGFLLGCVHSLLAIDALLSTSLPKRLEGQDLVVVGEVEEMPVIQDGITRFRLVTRSVPGEPALEGSRLALSWRQPPQAIRAGQVWSLSVRANRRNGSLNPGLFDYEAWLFAEGISGRGYVRGDPPPRLLGAAPAPVSALRARVKSALGETFAEAKGNALVDTLVLGDTSSLSPAQWRLVNSTGVIHLLIISGLHVGLIAWIAHGIAGLAGCSIRLRGALTLLAAGLYALLSGWGLPVQRAFTMLAVFAASQMLQRKLSPATQYFTAMLFCLLSDPFATLRTGFWLSFLAVGLLLAMMASTNSPHRRDMAGGREGRLLTFAASARTAIKAQWIIFAGMAPVLLLALGRLPALSFFTNLLAIPYVGLILVPVLLAFALLSLFLPPVAVTLAPAIDMLTGMLWQGLALAASAGRQWHAEPAAALAISLAIPLAGVLLLLLPRGILPLWPGLLAVAVMLPYPEEKTPDAEIRFLDVGQGLAVLIMNGDSVTVYDTGPAYGARYNTGSQVVVPSLRQAGFAAINSLVVSHGDNDHAGGFAAILEEMEVTKRIVTPENCSGTWQDGDMQFELIQFAASDSDSNNASCMLLITFQGIRALLTGDIEKDAELRLPGKLDRPVDIISVPHHGSATSSSPALLNRLMPDVAVISAGYRNRFGHPHPEVVARYQRRHTRLLNTASAGAVSILVRNGRYRVETEREKRPAVWRRE